MVNIECRLEVDSGEIFFEPPPSKHDNAYLYYSIPSGKLKLKKAYNYLFLLRVNNPN
jgi:hypothetical protein